MIQVNHCNLLEVQLSTAKGGRILISNPVNSPRDLQIEASPAGGLRPGGLGKGKSSAGSLPNRSTITKNQTHALLLL